MDIIFLLDSLRYDSFHQALSKNKQMQSYFDGLTKFSNCYAQSGWTPLAIAHMLDCTMSSNSGILPLSLKPANPVIWKKRRNISTNKLKRNIINLYDNSLMVLFEWHSKATVYDFYQTKSMVKVKTYNRYIDSNYWNAFEYTKAVNETVEFINKAKSNDKSIIFIRLMGTHTPYYTKTDTHLKCKQFNKKNDFKDMAMTGKYKDIFYGLYKYSDYKLLQKHGESYLVNTQADGFINDWTEFCEPVVNALKQKDIYDESQIVFFADHGETLTKYAHLLGHARYCNPDVLHVPLYVKFSGKNEKSEVAKTVRNIDILYTLATNSGLVNKNKAFQNVDAKHLVDGPEVKRNEFHCKDDYLFYFQDVQKYFATLLSNKKKLLSNIQISKDLRYEVKTVALKSAPLCIQKVSELASDKYQPDSKDLQELFIGDESETEDKSKKELKKYRKLFVKYI
jgi:hypothetical protein